MHDAGSTTRKLIARPCELLSTGAIAPSIEQYAGALAALTHLGAARVTAATGSPIAEIGIARRERASGRCACCCDPSALVRHNDCIRGACEGQRASFQTRRDGCFHVDRSRHVLDLGSLWALSQRALEGTTIEAADSDPGVLVRMVAVSTGNASLHRAQMNS